jgi:glyoxylate reductase
MDLLLVDAYPNRQFLQSLKELVSARSRLGLGSRESSIDYVGFDEALARADYVSLHVPLTDETHHLMNAESLRKMKPTAFLINTSRGPVVDEFALATALQQGWIAGAALDVFEKEPLPADSPLREPELEDRIRLFHHFASATRETRLSPDPAVGMAGRCVQGLLDVLQGNYGGDPARMPYVVNKEAFGS